MRSALETARAPAELRAGDAGSAPSCARCAGSTSARRPQRVLFVVNPQAGDGIHAGSLAGAFSDNTDAELTFTCFDAPRARQDELLSRVDAVIVFGGDGTLNGWLGALASRQLPVALFPAGTVNNLAHTLELRRDWQQLWQLLDSGALMPLQLLSVNGRLLASYGTFGVGAENSRYMHATRASVGRLRRMLPMLQTPIFAARTIFAGRAYVHPVRFCVDGQWHERVTPGVYVTRQRALNKFIDLDWEPREHPERFMLVMLKDHGQFRLMRTLYRLYAYRSIRAIAHEVELWLAAQVEFENTMDAPMLFCGDGEPFFSAARLRVSVAHAPLQIVHGLGHGA